MAYEDLNTIHNPSTSGIAPASWGDQIRDNFDAFITGLVPYYSKVETNANYSAAYTNSVSETSWKVAPYDGRLVVQVTGSVGFGSSACHTVYRVRDHAGTLISPNDIRAYSIGAGWCAIAFTGSRTYSEGDTVGFDVGFQTTVSQVSYIRASITAMFLPT